MDRVMTPLSTMVVALVFAMATCAQEPAPVPPNSNATGRPTCCAGCSSDACSDTGSFTR